MSKCQVISVQNELSVEEIMLPMMTCPDHSIKFLFIVVHFLLPSENFSLKQTIGCPFLIKTAPTPLTQASHLISNKNSKLGKASTDSVFRIFSIVQN